MTAIGTQGDKLDTSPLSPELTLSGLSEQQRSQLPE
jgi:hypothetical protein